MKKVKIFLGVACVTVALTSAAFTKANAGFANPEYYISDANQCVQNLTPGLCGEVAGTCLKDVGQSTLKQIYKTRTSTQASGCQNPLAEKP